MRLVVVASGGASSLSGRAVSAGRRCDRGPEYAVPRVMRDEVLRILRRLARGSR